MISFLFMQHVFLPFAMQITNIGATPDAPAADPRKASSQGIAVSYFTCHPFCDNFSPSKPEHGIISHTEIFLVSIQKCKIVQNIISTLTL